MEGMNRRSETYSRCLYPATLYDLTLIPGNIFLSGSTWEPVALGFTVVPLCFLVDLPFSFTTDTFLLPYDIYRLSTDERPLSIAVEDGSVAEIEMLLKKGVDPNNKDKYGSPLYSACLRGEPEIVELLIKYGADVKVKNRDGETTLMPVVRNYYMDVGKKKAMIIFLVKKGVDVNATYSSSIEEKYGFKPIPETALDMVRAKDSEEIIQLLRSHGAKTAAELQVENKIKEN